MAGTLSESTYPATFTGISLSDLARDGRQPGVYVSLYRPNGVIDNADPLPYYVSIYNGTGVSFDPWHLTFSFDGVIEHAWNATVEHDGTTVHVTPEPWNRVLRQGQLRHFGFVGSSNDGARPRPEEGSYVLRGTEIDLPPLSATSGHDECELEVTFVVQAEGRWWESQSWSAFGEFYVRNLGDEPADWALKWDGFGSGRRTVRLYDRLVDGEIYVASSALEGPIEPGGTRSFGTWGPFIGPPTDVVACPRDVVFEYNPVREAFEAAYAALSAEDKRRLECGRLVWNGTSFGPPSPLLGAPRRPCE